MKKILFVLLFALLSAAAFSQAGRMFPTFGGATGACELRIGNGRLGRRLQIPLQ